ncbi:Mannosylfructose-phosphate synthase [Rhodobacteraceae bacterium THAF1]|uniref:glycosyltransferase family 4 protein n=1 Tax=Palleronia sp. THAF1 TaxID=2587842 RepID=UPI000F3F5674|nr:glycosyltransferase family 4 protein [Palleronia sp. THAF1]QFU08937.1 Mannosylfructose-phosphate synthase [Palleronia sp. THAF1]VDC24333.1 Mannosylfructose-phosphate synthase [Rhodobacteraceae bacterium THAF1]
MPELFVTNYNPRYTGVSATAERMAQAHLDRYDLALVGKPLHGLPDPISPALARKLSRTPSNDRPCAVWHVRRDPEMLSAIYARDVLRLPIRTVFTSAAKHRHSAFPRWLISKMDAVIATSPEAAAFFPDVAATLPHGIDLGRFSPAPDRRAAWDALGYGGSEGVAIVGRIRASKGTDVFVDAMCRVMPDRPRMHALVIGQARPADRAFVEALHARIAEAGLTGRFHFLGDTPNDQVRQILPALSLVVNVARYEPFGVVPAEGMASGTPFVCSDTGYYRAFSDDGRCGLIVPVEDAPATAAAVSELLADADRLEAMGRAARAKAEADHSIQAEADGAAEIYERLWAGDDLAVHRG